MNFSTINWPAIVVAALSAFMVGGLWYSNILFGKVWMADSSLDIEIYAQETRGKYLASRHYSH